MYSGVKSAVAVCLLVSVTSISAVNIQSNGISARLLGEEYTYVGLIQLRINGTWGYLCDTHENANTNKAVDTVCNQLGYNSGMTRPGTALNTLDPPSYWTTDLECDYEDKELATCKNSGFKLTLTCPKKISQIWCFAYDHFDDEQDRGVIYIYYNNSYWSLCGPEFKNVDAHVYCKHSGFYGGIPIPNIDYRNSRKSPNNNLPTTGMMSTSYNCSSDMDNLNQCRQFSTGCKADAYPAMVVCTGKLSRIGRVSYPKVKDYYSSFGPLLMYNEVTAQNLICDKEFGEEEAGVACRDAGFQGAGRVLPPYYRGETMFPYKTWPVSYRCTGEETRLADCRNFSVSCDGVRGFVSVACDLQHSVVEDTIRVLPSGMVQVFHDGIWAPVNSLYWNKMSADVVCIKEGYDSGEAYINVNSNIKLLNSAWKYNYFCSGEGKVCNVTRDEEEARLHSNSVAMVECFHNDSSIQYSLKGGRSNYGYVVITANGTSGYIANLNTVSSNYIADTACRSLGFYSGDIYDMSKPTDNLGDYRVVSSCAQDFPLLHRCSGFQWNCPNASLSRCQDNLLSVFCYGRVRLGVKYGKSSGLVLYYYNNKYVTYCADDFTMFEADLVCKKLKYPGAKAIVNSYTTDVDYMRRSKLRLQCPANAESMDDCMSVYQYSCKSVAVHCDDGISNGDNNNTVSMMVVVVNLLLVACFLK